MDLFGTLCPVNGLTCIVYMTEGYLLKAPPLNIEVLLNQLKAVGQPQNRLPPLPTNRKWFKASISPKRHIRATPLIPRPFWGRPEGDASENASVAPTWAQRWQHIQWMFGHKYLQEGNKCLPTAVGGGGVRGRANRMLKERSISLANNRLRMASGGSSTVSFRLSSPQTTDWVMKQWRHVSGFHRA